MKAIVTGGAGFIGSHIAERLLGMGVEVVIFDDLSSGDTKNIPKGAIFLQADVSDWDEIGPHEVEFEDCDVIFHNAASKKNVCLRDPRRDLIVNGGSTLLMLQLAVKHRVDKFCHASTGSVYGECEGTITEKSPLLPVSYYGVSKLAGEKYVSVFAKEHGLDTTILRYFHIYGSRQNADPDLGGVIAIFKKQIREGQPVNIWGDGGQQRLFTHVSSAVDANIEAWENPLSTGEIFNCAAEEQTTITKLAHLLGAEDVIHGPPLVGDIYKFSIDNSKIKNLLGVKFISLEEGLKK